MSDNEPTFPLQWPVGWPRTKYPTEARFGVRGQGVSMSAALDFVEEELQRLGARYPVISTNVRTRLDGRPLSNQGRPIDTGVAVYFTLKERRTVLACDKWNRPEANLWAIAKHIDALRGQNRWGVGSVEQAFAGYAALPHRSGPDPWEVLGLTCSASEEQVLAAYRQKARTAHPDAGGSHDAFAELSQAKDIALATIRSRGRSAA
jgi:hypothetical protein